jgi:hypothetical protein
MGPVFAVRLGGTWGLKNNNSKIQNPVTQSLSRILGKIFLPSVDSSPATYLENASEKLLPQHSI